MDTGISKGYENRYKQKGKAVNDVSFGEWLKRTRKAAGLTQAQLADEAGCSAIAIRKMEAEERRPSDQIAERLAVIFNIPIKERKDFLRFARGRVDASFMGPEQKAPWQTLHGEALHNLPSPLTSFIGRERELSEIVLRLSRSRLVTLKGPGGVGKTRLAIQAAGQVEGHFVDGVCWVDLSALTNVTLIPQAVAKAIGLQEISKQSIEEILLQYLRSKNLLLVLDNCEHIIEGCAQLAGLLLLSCPELKILATSREALGVLGEEIWSVPVLSLPNPQKLTLLDLLLQYEGIRLFVDRASAAKPGFQLTEQNAIGVIQVCLRLDGMPLAIELAAARASMFSINEIARYLDDRFSLLSVGSRASMPRHQTLRAAIDWSHDLLTPPEQELFRRLAIFSKGFTLEAAEVVTADEGTSKQTVNLLGQLINKSLLIVENPSGEGESRYGMLETIHEYAAEKLREAGETDPVFERYCKYFIELAEKAEPKLKSAEQLGWLLRLEAEHGNFRSCLQGLIKKADSASALKLANHLAWFWFRQAHLVEGRAWIEQALAISSAAQITKDRAMALFGAARLARLQGDFTGARKLAEESLMVWKALEEKGGFYLTTAFIANLLRDEGDTVRAKNLLEECIAYFRKNGEMWNLAWSLTMSGLAIRDLNDYVLAWSRMQDSIALGRNVGDDWLLAYALHGLTLVAYRQGKYETAFSLMKEVLEIRHRMKDKHKIAYSIHNLGVYSLAQEKVDQARSFFEKDLYLYEEVGDKSGIALALQYQGLMARWDGDLSQARFHYERGLRLAQETGPIWISANYFLWLADLAAEEGQFERSVLLCSAAKHHLENIGSFWDAFETATYERIMTHARTSLGEARYLEAEKEGKAISLQQATHLALT